MKDLLLWGRVFLIFLTVQSSGQSSSTSSDLEKEAHRIETLWWQPTEDIESWPKAWEQYDSLYSCCIAGKAKETYFYKRTTAILNLFKGASTMGAPAKEYFEKSIVLFSELGDSLYLAIGYTLLCDVLVEIGDTSTFNKLYKLPLQLALNIQAPDSMGLIYNFIAVHCYSLGKYAEAANLNFEVLKLIDKYPNAQVSDYKSTTYQNIAGIYRDIGDTKNALIYAKKAVEVAKETGKYLTEHLCMLSSCLIDIKDYQQALDIIVDLQKNNPINYFTEETFTYKLSICYRNLGQPKIALKFAQQGAKRFPKSYRLRAFAHAQLELANCRFALGQKKHALRPALNAYEAYLLLKHIAGTVNATELISKIYQSQGNYAAALKYNDLRNKYQQNVERQQSTRQLAFGEFTRENELKNTRREAEVQAQLTQHRNIRYALFAGLGVLALLAFLLYNRYRFKQRTNEQLEAKNQEVEAARLRAEKSEAFKSRFLANMSHEIRTPLHGIAGYTDLVLETALTEKQRRYISSIHHSTERLMEVVNDILDISKLEAGEVKLRQVHFPPARIAHDVQEALSVRAENKGIALTVHIGQGVPEAVLGDPTRLYQILMNLAGNAVKFTSVGSVQLAVRQLAVGSQALPNSNSLIFTVKDTGIGIPSEKLSSIFDSFQQADDDTTARFGGTGLGLTIARELVQLHGSDIQVESRTSPSGGRGAGSSFSFSLSLPLANAADLAQPTTSDGHLFFDKKLRILLADDNAFNREIATEALLRHFENVEITEAENGKEAIGFLENQDFDLVLMDMQMPEMNGTEATRLIRQQLGSDIPIIALTASATPEEIEKALESGMDRHLAKPFKPHELAQAIAEVLGLGSPARDFPSFENCCAT